MRLLSFGCRSFGGATVHDMFNFLSVLILLPLEVITGYLETITTAILANSRLQGGQSGGPVLLDVSLCGIVVKLIQYESFLVIPTGHN